MNNRKLNITIIIIGFTILFIILTLLIFNVKRGAKFVDEETTTIYTTTTKKEIKTVEVDKVSTTHAKTNTTSKVTTGKSKTELIY